MLVPENRQVLALQAFVTHWLVPDPDAPPAARKMLLTPTEQRVALWLIGYGYVYPEGIGRAERFRIWQALGLLPRQEQAAIPSLLEKGLVVSWDNAGETWYGVDPHARPNGRKEVVR